MLHDVTLLYCIRSSDSWDGFLRQYCVCCACTFACMIFCASDLANVACAHQPCCWLVACAYLIFFVLYCTFIISFCFQGRRVLLVMLLM